MSEVRIPLVLSLTLDGVVIVLKATMSKEENQPYILVCLEPLFN